MGIGILWLVRPSDKAYALVRAIADLAPD